jgi:hypothetical protein
MKCVKNESIYTVFDVKELKLEEDEEEEEEIEGEVEGTEAEEEEEEEWEFKCALCRYWFARYVIAKDWEDARNKAMSGEVLCRRCLFDVIYYEEYGGYRYGLVSWETTLYQGLIGRLHNSLGKYIRAGIERARAARDAIRLAGDPVEVEGKRWDGGVGAVAGDSAIISFADRDVGIATAVALVGGEIGKRHRMELIEQGEGESFGEFSDRLELLKEKLTLALAAGSIKEVSLLMVGSPLIPRPKYPDEYVERLKTLTSEAEKAGTALIGFVKRPQSSFLEELRETGLTDRAALYMVLEEGQVYPWPPRRWEERGFEVMYTYIMLAPHPAAGVFRVDAPAWMGEGGFFKALRHIVATSEPESPIPTKLSFAEEEAKMSRWFLRKVYRKVFDREASEVEPALWALVTLGWEE